MHIVVTGAAGFLGTALTARLRAAGHAVRSIDLREHPYGNVGDVRRTTDLHRVVDAGTDVLVHLAAVAGVRPSLTDPDRYLSHNVLGTSAVLQTAQAAGVPRVVLASSSSVYGNVQAASQEDSPLIPLSPYAASKVSAEALARSYAERGVFEVAAVRPFTVYGPGQRDDMAITRFLGLIRDGGTARLWPWVRDFTYVEDLVDGLVRCLDARLVAPFRAFNLGSGRPVSAAELHQALADVTGCTLPVNWGLGRSGEPAMTHADTERARHELGFSAETSLRDGLAAQAAAVLGTSSRVPA